MKQNPFNSQVPAHFFKPEGPKGWDHREATPLRERVLGNALPKHNHGFADEATELRRRQKSIAREAALLEKERTGIARRLRELQTTPTSTPS